MSRDVGEFMNSNRAKQKWKFLTGVKFEAGIWFALVVVAGAAALMLLLAYGLNLMVAGAKGGLPKEKEDRAFHAANQAWLEALNTKSNTDLDYAERLLTEFIENYPERPGARNRLADVYELQGRAGESLLERARDLILLSQGLPEQDQKQASEEALDLLTGAKNYLRAESVDLLTAKFEAAMLSRDPEMAVQFLETLEGMNAEEAQLNWLKARLTLALGHRPGAIGLLRSAIEDDPGFRPAVVLLGRISTSLPEALEAAKALDALLQTRKEDPELWHLLGEALLRSGQADEAVAALEEAWRLAPDNDLTAHRLAEALERTDQPARAGKIRQAARQLNPAPNPPPIYQSK